MGADQPHNTQRCVELGTASALDVVTFTPEDACRTVVTMLDEVSHRQAARRIQAEINTLPEPAQALGLMAALAEPTRTTRLGSHTRVCKAIGVTGL